MKTIRIENKDLPLPAPLHVPYCDSFFCRLRGLMFRSNLDTDKGLLLVEKRDSRMDTSIHMLFVFMDLAVIWINSDNVVVDTVLARRGDRLTCPVRQPDLPWRSIHPG